MFVKLVNSVASSGVATFASKRRRQDSHASPSANPLSNHAPPCTSCSCNKLLTRRHGNVIASLVSDEATDRCFIIDDGMLAEAVTLSHYDACQNHRLYNQLVSCNLWIYHLRSPECSALRKLVVCCSNVSRLLAIGFNDIRCFSDFKSSFGTLCERHYSAPEVGLGYFESFSLINSRSPET